MILNLIVLFFTPLLSGLAIFFVPKGKSTNFKLMLVFAGSYLFAITVIHILPELYIHHADFQFVGIFVLAGFFLQQLLEYFTSGIEHGHIHLTHEHSHHGSHDHHHHHSVSALVLLLALCVHAFLEGGMLARGGLDTAYDVNAILLGIALHRAPAAFALMTVLAFQLHSRKKAVPYLIGFSLAAPVGLLFSTFLADKGVLSSTGLIYLYALVSGNFLHISTTIVFESSPEHRFNAKKMIVAIVGSLLAVGVNYFVN